MTGLEYPTTPADMQPVIPLMAIVALRYGDSSLASPVEYGLEESQIQIFKAAVQLAVKSEVPLIVPRGLETMVDESGVEIVPIKSKTTKDHSLAGERKYYEHISRWLSGDDEDATKTTAGIWVVGNRVSIGSVRRHCEESGIALLGLNDVQ